MDEKDMLQWLKEECEEIEVPKELHPENIRKQLEAQKRKKQRIRRQLSSAAALVLCSGVIFMVGNIVRNEMQVTKSADTQNSDVVVVPTEQQEEAEEEPEALGELYTVAGNYGEVYDVIEKNYTNETKYGGPLDVIREFFSGGVVNKSDVAENEMADAGAESANDSAPNPSAGAGYSKTNLQTEGVDESDIVKTDGKYIYAVQNGQVVITDIQNDALTETSVITPPADSIREMFVDGDRLYLIAEGMQTTMVEDSSSDVVSDAYYMDTEEQTVLYTYDITNRAQPKLSGKMSQDGTYQTSRKIGDIIYMFTDYYMPLPDATKKEAVDEEKMSSWLPKVEGRVISYDCIYLPERGNMGKLITSVDVNKPSEVLDSKLMVTNSGQVYVSNEAIYIYSSAWGNTSYTEIAKFSMKNGKIRGVAGNSVNGEILDTFAINEYQNNLRVLTTEWDESGQKNSVYVLDETLNMTGKITGLAPGEQIYSARFMGNTGYFVTYRNTDPLFTVDFSDPANPQIKGELKVTGFSEYLHFWGENKLLGIGYETDPETGSRIGMKLSMFDISDPCNVVEENRYVMKNVSYSPALYNYKCVLADKEKNIIGFAVQKDDYESTAGYLIFTYEDGFENVFSEEISDGYGWNVETYRGLYAGSRFYFVGEGEITVYDMENDFQKIAK